MFSNYKGSILSGAKESITIHRGDDGISVEYAPFDYVNKSAKLAIFGITPGRHQADVASRMAREAIELGRSDEDTLRLAKQAASFSGPMRANLVDILNHLNIDKLIGVGCSSEIFNENCELAHFNSVLRYPVFVDGKNYSGRSPRMLRHPVLKRMIDDILIDELQQLGDNTLLIPLGASVEEALNYAVEKSDVPGQLVVKGLPHPSGANIERIKYFLGLKSREELSVKVNPEKIDRGRDMALQSIATFQAAA